MHGHGARLIPGENHHGVDVDVTRPRDHERAAVRDVLRLQGCEPLIDRGGLTLVTPEADEAELRLDQPGVYLRYPDRPAEELLAENACHRPYGELRRVVAPAADVRLVARDRADHHHVAVATSLERRQQPAGHPQTSHHVALKHREPVLVVGILDAI